MNPDELATYVAAKRKEGLSDDTIKTILLSSGYSLHDAAVAIAAGTLPPPKTDVGNIVHHTPTVQAARPSDQSHTSVKSDETSQPTGGNVPWVHPSVSPQSPPSGWRPFFPELFKIYRERFWALFGALALSFTMIIIGVGAIVIILILAAVALVAIASTHMALAIFFGVILFALGFLAITWVGSVGGLAVLNIALRHEERVGIGASLKLGFAKAWQYLWLTMFMGLIIFGAFTLLIIPGIFLAISFSLAGVVFLAEDQRLADAFLRSRDLVKGHWWYVYGCLLAVWFVPGIVVSILRAYAGSTGAIIGTILNILIVPLGVIASVVLYKNLQSLKPTIETQPASRKWKYALFILPFSVLLIALLIFLPAILPKIIGSVDLVAQSRDSNRIGDMDLLKGAIALYLLDTGDFSACQDRTIYASAPVTPPAGWQLGANAGQTGVDGTGWLPFQFASSSVGSPLLKLPLDPVNNPDKGLVYVMACDPKNQTFKLEAKLESAAYNQGGSKDFTSTDHGIDPKLYEVGTDLNIVIPQN